jgi:hypothetical protein
MLLRKTLEKNISSLFANTLVLEQEVNEMAVCPDTISNWLGRLKLLYGVPLNYLVPDEGMLPPESIRFFYLDANWTNALVDGAFSIGRNLTAIESTVSMAMDKAASPLVNSEAAIGSASIRAAALGVTPPVVSFKTVSGFMLRSTVVKDCPGLGVNPYPVGGTPDNTDPNKVVLLNILRMERLGPDSDTLICLVEGDIFRVDIHEAPEALHYGINSFSVTNNVISSEKTIFPFTKNKDGNGPSVTMDMKNPQVMNLATSNCFRSTNDPRTLKMQTLASLIAASQQPAITKIDASEMGFEMVEGVGMVSFLNKKTN